MIVSWNRSGNLWVIRTSGGLAESRPDLSESALKVLKLPPKTTTYPPVDTVMMEIEVEKMMVKLRWEEQSRCQRTQDMLQGDLRTDQEKMVDAMVTNPHTGITDLSRMRATDFHTVKEVCIPQLRGKEEEQRLQELKAGLLTATDKYVADHCDDQGRLLKDPFPKDLKEGINELKEVIKGGSHVYYETDKSGMGSLNSHENYFRLAGKHTQGHQVVTPDFLATNERHLNHHSLQVGRALGLGSSLGDGQEAQNQRSIEQHQSCSSKSLLHSEGPQGPKARGGTPGTPRSTHLWGEEGPKWAAFLNPELSPKLHQT